MKFLNTFKYLLALALVGSLFTFNSCKDDDDDDGHTEDHQHLTLSFHQHVGTDELVLNEPYTSNGGVKFTVSRINYYLSGLKMQIDHDGNYHNYDSVYILVDENTADVELGEIPAGSMHGLEFAVGIEDSAVNHSDPSTYPSNHPLAPQNPSMNWGWATGYVFFALEGMVDTDNDGTVDTNMELHVGLDKNVALFDSGHHFTVTAGTDVIQGLELDLLKVLDGVDLATEYMTHSMGSGDSLAMKIAANLSNAFEIE